MENYLGSRWVTLHMSTAFLSTASVSHQSCIPRIDVRITPPLGAILRWLLFHTKSATCKCTQLDNNVGLDGGGGSCIHDSLKI